MKRMQGFSILELMVSMALGLLISAAAIQLFLANQVSLNYQRGMNDVQANGRFVIDQITRDVRIAGLGPSSTAAPVAGIVMAIADLPGLANTSAITRNGVALAGLLDNSDQLVLQYYAMAETVDCEGNTVAAGRYVVARYFIRADGGAPALACDGGSHDGATLLDYEDDGVVLLSGVDSFQILYGVDDKAVSSANNGEARIARYVTANVYSGYASKPAILAVRLGIYMHAQEIATGVERPSKDVQVLDEQILTTQIPDDRLLRRLFISTVALRNVDLKGV